MQRMYFQCDPSEDLEAWSADRIWAELQARVGANGYTLQEGPIISKTVLPTGAKGLNLALADVRLLAELLELAVRKDDAAVLDGYTDRALARVWKSQHFSYWMTTMLHTLAATTGFDARRQLGELSSVVESRAGSANLAEAYCGWPEARA